MINNTSQRQCKHRNIIKNEKYLEQRMDAAGYARRVYFGCNYSGLFRPKIQFKRATKLVNHHEDVFISRIARCKRTQSISRWTRSPGTPCLIVE